MTHYRQVIYGVVWMSFVGGAGVVPLRDCRAFVFLLKFLLAVAV